MIDSFHRNIDYLRISVTDRCNLRCMYCMPQEGVSFIPHDEILRYEEILRLAGIFAKTGIKKIKITGGEPLVRKNICELISDLKQIQGIEQVTLTTNGILAGKYIDALELSGVDCINISLDTLNPVAFEKITGKREFPAVWESLYKLLERGKIPVKVNCVPMGIEGQEFLKVAELARGYPVHVRYIEMMPIGTGRAFKRISQKDIMNALTQKFGEANPISKKLGNGPSKYYQFQGFLGAVGFISAVSHKFCENCNRIRLTSRGFLKTCLQYDDGIDLGTLIRSGTSDDYIEKKIMQTVRDKPKCHEFGNNDIVSTQKDGMFRIGG